jgi:hypothetical protein
MTDISTNRPSIGNIPNKTDENTWIYKNGVWQKDEIRKTTIENMQH